MYGYVVLSQQFSHADLQQPRLLSPTVRTNYLTHACLVVGALETGAPKVLILETSVCDSHEDPKGQSAREGFANVTLKWRLLWNLQNAIS